MATIQITSSFSSSGPQASGTMRRSIPALIRRGALLVKLELNISAWVIMAIIAGIAMVTFSSSFPAGLDIAVALSGIALFVAGTGKFVWVFAGKTTLADHIKTREKLYLLDQGINNPTRHIKRNPELVKEYERFACRIGIILDYYQSCLDRENLHEIAIFVLSGMVSPDDTHLITAALNRGITEPSEVISTVKEMKLNGNALSDGAL